MILVLPSVPLFLISPLDFLLVFLRNRWLGMELWRTLCNYWCNDMTIFSFLPVYVKLKMLPNTFPLGINSAGPRLNSWIWELSTTKPLTTHFPNKVHYYRTHLHQTLYFALRTFSTLQRFCFSQILFRVVHKLNKRICCRLLSSKRFSEIPLVWVLGPHTTDTTEQQEGKRQWKETRVSKGQIS